MRTTTRSCWNARKKASKFVNKITAFFCRDVIIWRLTWFEAKKNPAGAGFEKSC